MKRYILLMALLGFVAVEHAQVSPCSTVASSPEIPISIFPARATNENADWKTDSLILFANTSFLKTERKIFNQYKIYCR